MGVGGGGRELKEALSLFRFHLSSFHPETPDAQAAPRGTFFLLSCETSLIHANDHVIPRAARNLAHSFAQV